jgi:hypothetical protein
MQKQLFLVPCPRSLGVRNLVLGGCIHDMEKRSVSKKLRFEIMKRDGFACRYCGATAVSTVLEVDHVLALANGGSNEPDNLVTACKDCNSGKSDRSLDDRALAPSTAGDLLEQSEQIKEYMRACKALQQAKEDVAQLVVNHWCERIDPAGMPRQVYNSLHYWLSTLGLEKILEAVEATGARGYCRHPERYFIAVV